MNDPYLRAIWTVIIPLLIILGLYLLFSWWFDFVGLTDNIAQTAATVEALR